MNEARKRFKEAYRMYRLRGAYGLSSHFYTKDNLGFDSYNTAINLTGEYRSKKGFWDKVDLFDFIMYIIGESRAVRLSCSRRLP